MATEQTKWFVVRTKPRRENLAEQSLARRGVTVFCPRILEPVGWKSDWTTVPLFPGYAFVRIDLQREYHTVAWTPGIKGFVAFGELPTPVHPDVVRFLLEEGGYDGVIRPAARLRAGERVKITRGPLAGLIGIIEKSCPERGRIRVLMEFLRENAPVELPIAAVGRL